ncbi:MAG TPA: trypsin-like peptidase domain-containing protein [Acetobacteraceae bacterium]|nr:trypsin-like peptidase domain-containing protein [Acetobacteraceae bacterium]
MPRIPPLLLQSSFYLYETRSDAENGEKIGGTGFFVGIQSDADASVHHTIAVTNWHVAVSGGASVIRVNKAGGGVDIFELEPSDWTFNPMSHDIAAVPIPIGEGHNCTVLTTAMFLTKERATSLEIAPGENVFMVGRFVDHDGKETNVPAVRFGHISMIPGAPIKQSNGASMESYCIDMHSRGGFSGSPVYAYRTTSDDLNATLKIPSRPQTFLVLLGISWGQFPELWQITPDGSVLQHSEQQDRYLIPGKYIKGMSGITCVAPSCAILELLQHNRIQISIQQEEEKLIAQQVKTGAPPTPEN